MFYNNSMPNTNIIALLKEHIDHIDYLFEDMFCNVYIINTQK